MGEDSVIRRTQKVQPAQHARGGNNDGQEQLLDTPAWDQVETPQATGSRRKKVTALTKYFNEMWGTCSTAAQ